MTILVPEIGVQREANGAALNRLRSHRHEPLFIADWERAVFMHYEVDAAALPRDVPFPLDLREGRAFVSIVAFSMCGLRFRFGGKLGKWLCRPIGKHEFLNVRTYVRHRGESAIYFLTEWLSNPLCVHLGLRTYGLPYHAARMAYQHSHETGRLCGEVVAVPSREAQRFCYQATIAASAFFGACASGSLDEFLLERYTAFTSRGQKRRFFRIWHPAWRQAPIQMEILDDALLLGRWRWFSGARLVGANYSPGVHSVWMGWPHRITHTKLKTAPAL